MTGADVRQILGEERIGQICHEHGLTEEDIQEVYGVLGGAWPGLVGVFHQNIQMIRATGGNLHHDQIFAAMAQIRQELAAKQQEKN